MRVSLEQDEPETKSAEAEAAAAGFAGQLCSIYRGNIISVVCFLL